MKKKWMAVIMSVVIGTGQPVVPAAGADVMNHDAARQEVMELQVTQEDELSGSVSNSILERETAIKAAEHVRTPGHEYDVVYKFSLTKASYLTIETVCHLFKSTGQKYSVWLGTSEGSMEWRLNSHYLDSETSIKSNTGLEPGTYWITIHIENEGSFSPSVAADPYIKIGVNAAPMIERSGNGQMGTDKKHAISIENGRTCWGRITGVKDEQAVLNAVKKQVFTFMLKRKTTVYFKGIIQHSFGLDADRQAALLVEAEDGSVLADEKNRSHNVVETSIEMDAGVYFAAISYPEFCECSLNVYWKDQTARTSANATVTKKIKNLTVKAEAGTKWVTGKTQRLAEVSIKVNGRTYSKRSGRKGNYKIKVPVLKPGAVLQITVSKKGYKNRSKTVTVKRKKKG